MEFHEKSFSEAARFNPHAGVDSDWEAVKKKKHSCHVTNKQTPVDARAEDQRHQKAKARRL